MRFVAYDHLGARRGVLDKVMSANYVTAKNELPTLTLAYPRRDKAHKWLQNNPEIAVEINTGATWGEIDNGRFVLHGTHFDYLEEVETINYDFIGIGEVLKYLYIHDAAGGMVTDEDGKIVFNNKHPEWIMQRLWDKAMARGWKGYTRTFGVEDIPGPRNVNVRFDTDTSLDGALNFFVRTGLLDYSWGNRWLSIYEAGSNDNDLTKGSNPLRFHLSGGPAGVDSAPEQGEHSIGVSQVVIIGENDKRYTIDTGYIPESGHRQVYIQHGGVRDQLTAKIVAQPTIARMNNGRKNTTRQFQLEDPRVRVFPFQHYRPGVWALVEKADGEWERMQIRQVGIQLNTSGLQGYVSLGDKVDSIIENFDARLQQLQSGL